MEVAAVPRSVTPKRTKKRKNQLPVALALAALVAILAAVVGQQSPALAIALVMGVLFGVVLQKSRFCFTAAFRDPVLTGGTSLSKAALLAIAVALAGFAIIQYAALEGGRGVTGSVNPVGWHIAIGATLFGVGAVISGGCASGTLMRIGEGFTMQMLSLVFFVVGSLWGAHDFGWWQRVMIDGAPKVHLPSIMGWPLAIALQYTALGLLYLLAHWWGNRRKSA